MKTLTNLREGYNDEERSIKTFVLHEVGNESNGLDSLSQAHLIRKNAIQIIIIQRHKPLQTFNLPHTESKKKICWLT